MAGSALVDDRSAAGRRSWEGRELIVSATTSASADRRRAVRAVPPNRWGDSPAFPKRVRPSFRASFHPDFFRAYHHGFRVGSSRLAMMKPTTRPMTRPSRKAKAITSRGSFFLSRVAHPDFFSRLASRATKVVTKPARKPAAKPAMAAEMIHMVCSLVSRSRRDRRRSI